MSSYLLHAVGPDQPGIVASVTHVLEELGCNLAESRMTILHGQFAIMLALDAPEKVSAEEIRSAIDHIGDSFDLMVGVREIRHDQKPGELIRTVAVSIYGADRPGIVAHVTSEVASVGGNIIDLATRVVHEQNGVSYVMLLTVALEPDVAVEDFQAALDRTAERLGVRCVVTLDDDDLF